MFESLIKQTLTDNRWYLCQILFAVFLIVLAVMDIRKKRLPILLLLSGIFFIIAQSFCGRTISVISLAAGGMVGIAFLLVSRITKEAFGYGDSILIVIMGAFLGFWNILYLLMGAFFMAAVFSAVMLIKTRFNRKASFPFVPFLTIAYIGGMLFGSYQR